MWRLTADELRSHGDQLALHGASNDVDYERFAGRAEAVADALTAAEVAPGERVALLSSERGHDEPVALAGVLCAGAVAIPIDASSPRGRVESLLRSSGCRAAVVDTKANALIEDCAVELARVELDEEGFVLASVGNAAETDVEPAQHLAGVLHTSGSTGTPKLVPVTCEALDAVTSWMLDLTELSGDDRVLRFAELTCDLSWFDHLATWRAGATLCTMSRRDVADARRLKERVRQLRPSVVYGVPSFFMKLCQTGATIDARVLCFAGAVYPPQELALLAKRAPHARLFNLYRQTETNVCTFHEVRREELDGKSEIPIGVACPYAALRLLADGGEVVGPGRGELVVVGVTALDGEHHTRDQVERGDDGLLYFRGRTDVF